MARAAASSRGAYLTPRALRGLRAYTYKATGYTWLDDVHTPFWNGRKKGGKESLGDRRHARLDVPPPALNRQPPPYPPFSAIVEHVFPRWLAPNLITLIGLALLVGGYLALTLTALDMGGTAPPWAHAAMGAATLLYLHLDCLDGKQARRTGSSSPLGQLFDHGCDALAVNILLVGVAATIDAGLRPRAVWGQLAVGGPWLMAHWEEYHSGVMLYGNGWWGVTEANYTLVALHFISAAFGARAVFGRPLTAAIPTALATRFPRLLTLAKPYTCTDGLLLCLYGCGVWQASAVIGRVFVLRSPRGLPAAERGHKQLGVAAQLSHLAQLALFVGVGTVAMLEPIWAGRSAEHTRAVFGLYGLAYALEASKLIMDHMAKEPFELAWWPVGVLAAVTACAAAGGVGPIDATTGVFIGLVIVAAGYVHYVVCVIGQICAFLGIKCLTIPVKDEGGGAAAAAPKRAAAAPTKKAAPPKRAAAAAATPKSKAAATAAPSRVSDGGGVATRTRSRRA